MRSSFCVFLQISKNVVELIVALFEVLHGAHDLFISIVVAESVEALGELSQFLCVGGVVSDHVLDESLQLCFGTVGMIVCAAVFVEMVVCMGMLMIVGVFMSMFVGVGYAVMGMLMGMTVSMGMCVAAVMAMFMAMTVFVIMHNVLL